MKRSLILTSAVGLGVMAVTAVLLFPRPPQPKPGASYKFMHCPKCIREFPYNVEKAGKACPRCGEESKLVPTLVSRTETAAGTGFGPFTAALLIELVIVLGVMVYLARPKSASGGGKDVYLHTNCRRCKQRLRFSAHKVGQSGKCPRCRHNLVFSDAAAENE